MKDYLTALALVILLLVCVDYALGAPVKPNAPSGVKVTIIKK